MSDITTPPPETLTLREAPEAAPRLGAADVMETLAGLLSSTNSRAVIEGLKLAAELARIVTEEQPGPVAVVAPDDLRRMGAAFAALIRNEAARVDWQTHPCLGGFLQSLYGRHPEARAALVTGATVNARHLRSRTPKRPTPPSPVPSPAVTPPVSPSDPMTVSPPLTVPCITCKQAPRRPNQRTCKGCHAEAMRESRRRNRARVTALTQAPQPTPWPPVYPQESPCEWCTQPFVPARKGQRFCGNICGGKAATADLEEARKRERP